MIHTPVCDLLGITHPIVLGGMASGTSVPLVAAVSNAGGLGTLGVTGLSAAQIRDQIAAIRAATDKPFGVNFLLFLTEEANFNAALEARPPVVSFAWARPEQDLRHYFHVYTRLDYSSCIWLVRCLRQYGRLKLGLT